MAEEENSCTTEKFSSSYVQVCMRARKRERSERVREKEVWRGRRQGEEEVEEEVMVEMGGGGIGKDLQ